MLLEVIAQSVADARAAAAGGADRLEVVREIGRGGLTPPIDLVRAIAAETSLPLRVMVRENDGFELAPGELPLLREATARFAAAGADGIVIGFALAGEPRLDEVAQVLDAVPGVRATFHRAFDGLTRPLETIDRLLAIPQIDRILTSGGDGTPAQRVARLRGYAERAGTPVGFEPGTTQERAGTAWPTPGRLTIIAGGGVTAELVSLLAASGWIGEVHVGRAARERDDPAAAVSAARVRRLRELLDRSTSA